MRKKTVKSKTKKKSKSRMQDWLREENGRYEIIPEMREVLEQWGRHGMTQTEIAAQIGISLSTLRLWTKKCPDMMHAIKNARACADARVENALFVKAIGYTKTLKKPIKVRRWMVENGKKVGEEEVIEYAEEEIHVPADMGAIAFYLKNRLPERWKERRIEIPEEDKDEAGIMCLKMLSDASQKAIEEAIANE